ncbi:MAG: Mth938-like domain-containing protein [Anaerolineae bacterium]
MKIDSYSFGRIVIEGHQYTQDLLIFPDHVDTEWWRKEGHALHPDDLAKVLAAKPKVLVVGTGNSGMMQVLPQTRGHLEKQGIQLIVQRTDEAWRTYNQLCRSGEVMAAFHLTC